ncbi:hypothetical protein ATANTOWER_024129, partial [Ataeniobius toweri]|nr:hypothetical protein [Ataeniobius toweri]
MKKHEEPHRLQISLGVEKAELLLIPLQLLLLHWFAQVIYKDGTDHEHRGSILILPARWWCESPKLWGKDVFSPHSTELTQGSFL